MNREKSEKSGFATAALVLGIVGIALSFIPIINNAAFILGLFAFIFAIMALIKKKSVARAIVSIVLAIASMGITIAMQKSMADAFDKATNELNTSVDNMSGNNTDEVLKNDARVDIGKFTVVSDEYGIESSKLVVTVKNKTTEKTSFSVKIEAINEKGERLTDDTVYANDLNSGQSQNFDAFTLIQSDQYDNLKKATFKIVSVSKV